MKHILAIALLFAVPAFAQEKPKQAHHCAGSNSYFGFGYGRDSRIYSCVNGVQVEDTDAELRWRRNQTISAEHDSTLVHRMMSCVVSNRDLEEFSSHGISILTPWNMPFSEERQVPAASRGSATGQGSVEAAAMNAHMAKLRRVAR